MQIEILSVKQETKPTKVPGKTTQTLNVAYKALSFGGKVDGKQLVSFGAQAESFKTLATAQQGDVFDVEVVKNGAGYNDWVSVKKSVGITGTAQPSTTTASGTTQASNPIRSTYETPEERAKKQIYIVRQSSLSTAAALLSVGAKAPPKTDEVLAAARQFEDFVFGNAAKDLSFQTLQDSDIE